MQPHQKLVVWRRAHELALLVLRLPHSPAPGAVGEIGGRLRRTVITLAVHIAEAASSSSTPHAADQLHLALSSSREASYLILLLAELRAISSSTLAKLEARADEVSKMLVGLIRTRRGRKTRVTAS